MHHRHRIPAGQALEAPLDLAIARIGYFLFDWNGVDVGRIQLERDFHTRRPGVLNQGFDKLASAGGAFASNDLIKGFNPFGDFFLGIRLRLRRKFQYAVINFLGCHSSLNDLRDTSRSQRRVRASAIARKVISYSSILRCLRALIASSSASPRLQELLRLNF